MKNVSMFLFAGLFATIFACTDPEKATVDPDSPNVERGVVKGRVLDNEGRSVKGAEIIASSTDFLNKTSHGYTDANGNYSFKVPTGIAEGSYSVDGTLTLPYHGKKFKVALYRTDSRVFSAYDGAVRDFVFRLTGPRSEEDDDYATPLGATLEVHPDFNNIDASQIDVILEPIGNLLDGSAGKKLVMPLSENSSDLQDIPLGYYKISAKNRVSDQKLVVKIKDTPTDFAPTISALFEDDNFEGSTEFRLLLLIDAR